MKKLVCTLLALAMLCSLMVVNVSAANSYEGEGFELVLDYDCEFEGGEEDEGVYSYICYLGDDNWEIELQVIDIDYMFEELQYEDEELDTCEELYDFYIEYKDEDEEEITIDGIPAFCEFSDDCCFIEMWSDNYYYLVDLECDGDMSAEELLDVFSDGFRITDSASWYSGGDTGADNKNDADKSDKTEKTDKDSTEEKSADNKDNTVIIIIAVVAGVAVVAVVAIVVLGKKKKQ